MGVPSVIKDLKTGQTARVTEFGQLVVAPLAYSTPVAVSMATPLIAYNFIEPAGGQSVVITDIIASADKSVSTTTPAEVIIYEAGAPDTLTSVADIVTPQLIRSGNFILTRLNLLVPEGLWVNATTDDSTIKLTIMYYRVPVEVIR